MKCLGVAGPILSKLLVARGLVVVGVAVLSSGIGCGETVALRTLTQTDVSGIPAGDATGTELSGTYLLVRSDLTGCRCRVGTCNLHAGAGATLTVLQQDGALTITDPAGNSSHRGVDANYTYVCGGASPFDSSGSSGETYGIEHGLFTVSGGRPVNLQYDGQATVTGTIGYESYDCDLALIAMADYQGP